MYRVPGSNDDRSAVNVLTKTTAGNYRTAGREYSSPPPCRPSFRNRREYFFRTRMGVGGRLNFRERSDRGDAVNRSIVITYGRPPPHCRYVRISASERIRTR